MHQGVSDVSPADERAGLHAQQLTHGPEPAHRTLRETQDPTARVTDVLRAGQHALALAHPIQRLVEIGEVGGVNQHEAVDRRDELGADHGDGAVLAPHPAHHRGRAPRLRAVHRLTGGFVLPQVITEVRPHDLVALVPEEARACRVHPDVATAGIHDADGVEGAVHQREEGRER
ncbi:MAG: hypothetical protein O2822_04350 [Chloroflexi bacterium]|nr:hypothetical protein [Chloroflexota bacterium]